MFSILQKSCFGRHFLRSFQKIGFGSVIFLMQHVINDIIPKDILSALEATPRQHPAS